MAEQQERPRVFDRTEPVAIPIHMELFRQRQWTKTRVRVVVVLVVVVEVAVVVVVVVVGVHFFLVLVQAGFAGTGEWYACCVKVCTYADAPKQCNAAVN